MPEQDVTTSEEQPEDFKSKWDTEKQRVEQAEANYKKAIAEKEAVAEQFTLQQQKITELTEQIAAKKEDTPYPEIDPDLTDRNVIKSIQQMRAELKTAKEELGELKAVATTYKATEEQRQAQAYQDRLIEKMCKPLDEEYGAKHRNSAKALADKLVNEGREKKPEDAIDAMYLMRKCYQTVSKKPAEKDDSVRTDSGSGGVSPPSGPKVAGTNQEIFADMRKDLSWRDEPIKEVV